MSLLSRLFGLESQPEDRDSDSVRRIMARMDGLDPERARFVAAFAYVLARIANADLKIEESEAVEMRRIVGEISGLSPSEAELATEIAVEQACELGGTENYIVTRELRRITEKNERVLLLRCALAVAAADDRITSVETVEVHSIGEELGLTRTEVNALRLEWRSQLAELRTTQS